MPASVGYAGGLLRLQGGIWAWLAVSGSIAIAVTLFEVVEGHRSWESAARVLGLLPVAVLLAAVFAITKFRLARRLRNGRDRVRKLVIAVELAMAFLGALMTAGLDPSGGTPGDSVAVAAFVGGCLSLAAAIRLLRRPAREYFASSGSSGRPKAGSSGASTVCYGGMLPPWIRIGPSLGACQ
jgi:hypothetical protein